jgi:uncharacterized phage infection (PIP) family protein YhgE
MLISITVLSLAIFGCGPKETEEEVTEEATEEATEETAEDTEEATEEGVAVNIEEMTAEIKAVVEEVNDYKSNHNMGNTDKSEFAGAFSGYVEKFEDLKTVYSVSTPTDEQKDTFEKLMGVLDTAIDAMSKSSEGAKAGIPDGLPLSMDGATKWQEVNEFFGIELE